MSLPWAAMQRGVSWAHQSLTMTMSHCMVTGWGVELQATAAASWLPAFSSCSSLFFSLSARSLWLLSYTTAPLPWWVHEAGSSPGQFCSAVARVLCSVVDVSPWLVHSLQFPSVVPAGLQWNLHQWQLWHLQNNLHKLKVDKSREPDINVTLGEKLVLPAPLSWQNSSCLKRIKLLF